MVRAPGIALDIVQEAGYTGIMITKETAMPRMNAVWVVLNEERPGVVSVFGVYASRDAAHRALKNASSGCWVDSPVDGDPVED